MPDCLCFAFPRRDMMYDVCSVILAGMLAGPKFAINYAGFLPRLRFCVNVSAWVRPSCPRLWGLRTISINRITLLIATAAGAIMYCWVLLLVCLFVFNSVVVDACPVSYWFIKWEDKNLWNVCRHSWKTQQWWIGKICQNSFLIVFFFLICSMLLVQFLNSL